MWGNSRGWMISAVIALGMGYMLFYVASPPTKTEPTNDARLAVANGAIALPVPADAVVPPGTKDCDAGDAYRKAIDDYQLSPSTYEKFDHGGQMDIHENELPAVGDILSGRDCNKFNLFSKDAARVVNYDNTEPVLDAIQDAGHICCTLGKLYTNETYDKNLQPDKAVALWSAAFVLGQHLYEERASWGELIVGHDLMQMAGINLADYYKTKSDPRADKIHDFLDAEGGYQLKLTEAFKIVGSVDENYAGPFAGDIFKIALSPAADTMFRVEALKHIGHYRYNARTNGDQLAARKTLKDLVNDKTLPPAVKAAANAAHDLTIEKHNMVGGGA